jgi:hypothetical protein
MKTILNDYEVMTLNEAYKRIKEGREDVIMLPSSFKRIRDNLPNLVKLNLIHKDSVKYCGAIVLTNKGINEARKLNEGINQ